MNILLLHPKTPDTFWSFKHVLDRATRWADTWTSLCRLRPFRSQQVIELPIIFHRFRRVARFL